MPNSLNKTYLYVFAGVGAGFLISSIFILFSSFAGDSYKTLQAVGLLIGTVAFPVPAIMFNRAISLKDLFRFNPVSGRVALYAVLVAIGLVVLTDGLDKVIGPSINGFLDRTLGSVFPELLSDRVMARLEAEFKIVGPLQGLLLFSAAVIFAGVSEEMLIRGMLQGSLEKEMRAFYSILISSVIFSLIHLNPWGGIQIFTIAIALGWVAYVCQSIYPTIIMHSINNGVVFLFNNTEPQNWYGDKTSINPLVLFIAALVFIMGVVGLTKEQKHE